MFLSGAGLDEPPADSTFKQQAAGTSEIPQSSANASRTLDFAWESIVHPAQAPPTPHISVALPLLILIHSFEGQQLWTELKKNAKYVYEGRRWVITFLACYIGITYYLAGMKSSGAQELSIGTHLMSSTAIQL